MSTSRTTHTKITIPRKRFATPKGGYVNPGGVCVLDSARCCVGENFARCLKIDLNHDGPEVSSTKATINRPKKCREIEVRKCGRCAKALCLSQGAARTSPNGAFDPAERCTGHPAHWRDSLFFSYELCSLHLAVAAGCSRYASRGARAATLRRGGRVALAGDTARASASRLNSARTAT